MNIEQISNFKMSQYQYAYGINVAKKALDLQKQDGDNLLRLIQSVPKPVAQKNLIDLYA
ncbi:MAG: putative motility protein [Calditerrivibrio sp.]|nr:putative motility protein [Calditerrivibrio sp.]